MCSVPMTVVGAVRVTDKRRPCGNPPRKFYVRRPHTRVDHIDLHTFAGCCRVRVEPVCWQSALVDPVKVPCRAALLIADTYQRVKFRGRNLGRL